MRAGRLDTGLVGRRLDALVAAELPADVLPAAAVLALAALEPSGAVVDPFDVPGRVAGRRAGLDRLADDRRRQRVGARCRSTRARGRAAGATVAVGDAEPVAARTAAGRAALRGRRDGCR